MDPSQQSDADVDEAMRLTVSRFRTKMEASNRQFLQDRIDEPEAMDLTDEEKLDKISFYMPYLSDQGIAQWADIKKYSSPYMDGVEPGSLVTDEWRQMFLETFEAFSNEMGFRDEDTQSQPLIYQCSKTRGDLTWKHIYVLKDISAAEVDGENRPVSYCTIYGA